MATFEDLTGQKFDRLTVIGRAETDKKGVYWLCKCNCGSNAPVIVKTHELKAGKKRSCGCLLNEWRNSKHSDIVGQKFGKLTVISYSHKTGKRLYFNCKCECGNEITVRKDGLLSGHSKSCGCTVKKWMHSGNLNKRHGLYQDRAYWVWAKVKARCYNPHSQEYCYYGGRGIKMCDEWLDPENFVKWCYLSGYDNEAPKGQCTLDRIDVNGNYEPSNCRWVTNLVQQNNRRNNRRFDYNGETKTISELAREFSVSYTVMYHWLIRKNRSIEEFIIDYTPKKRS